MTDGSLEITTSSPVSSTQLVKEASVNSPGSAITKNSTPLNLETLKDVQEKMELMKSGATGGATGEGMEEAQALARKTALYKVKLYGFLKEKVGINTAQLQDLPEDLQKAIFDFAPTNEQELDAQFSDILQKLTKSGKVTPEQKVTIDEMQKAIVEEKLLSADDVFQAIKISIDESSVSPEERLDTKNALAQLQQGLKNPSNEVKVKSFRKELPKIAKIIGGGGSALMLFAMWRALKENMIGGQAAG